MPQPGASDALQQGQRRPNESQRTIFNLKAETLLKAGRAHNPSRIVNEAETVKNADPPRPQIKFPTPEIQELTKWLWSQSDRQGVDRKIPAMQVQLD